MTLAPDAVWLITGCSTGFGREFALAALERGFRVVATARQPDVLADIEGRFGDRVLVLPLDVTDGAAVDAVMAQALSRFGAVDVLVNNAGHGFVGAVEEGEDEAVRALFDVNFFGLARITRAVLPGMRARGRGWIVNISSIAGLSPNAGAGYYAASKFAVEGLSDALALEVQSFGIKVLVVEPGPFRTDFGGRSMRTVPAIPAYADTLAGQRRRDLTRTNGKQPGDPAKAVALVLEALRADNPPRRLVIGDSAINRALAKLEANRQDIETWAERGRQTTFETV